MLPIGTAPPRPADPTPETCAARSRSTVSGVIVGDIRVSLRTPMTYQSNDLYDVWVGRDTHWLAKVFTRPAEYREAPQREFGALRLLAPLDVAPQPVFLQPEPLPPLGPVVLYAFMEGEMWDRRPPDAAGLAALAEMWLRINAQPTAGLWMARLYERPLVTWNARFRDGLRAYARWTATRYPPGRQAAARCLELLPRCRRVLRELARAPAPLCFCTTDARFANVIRRPDGRLGLVDWEDSGLRDPAWSLADLMTHANQEDLFTHDEWQPFLEPYLNGRCSADPGLPARLRSYRLLESMLWLTGLVGFGIRRADNETLSGWEVNGLPANERLRRYLARATAWPDEDFGRHLADLGNLTFFPTCD